MNRALIAIDIDDVLADSTDALRVYINQKMGLDLAKTDYTEPVGNYWGYYENVWKRAGLAGGHYLAEFHQLMGEDQSNIPVIEGAQAAIQKLQKRYDLVAITSRELFTEDETKKWIDKHFKGDFKKVVLLGEAKSAVHTKGELCLELGADWLLDDNVDHCLSARDAGLKPVLFGNFGWQHEFDDSFPHCKSWRAVQEYFDGRN